MPEGVKIRFIENDQGVYHTIILPPEPGALKGEELDKIAWGKCAKKDQSDREIPYAAPLKDLTDL